MCENEFCEQVSLQLLHTDVLGNTAAARRKGIHEHIQRPSITHFLCSPLLLALARNTTVDTAKMTNATVRAPTPVEPTCTKVAQAHSAMAHEM
jgi:hypothetical protein